MELRQNWSLTELREIHDTPLMELVQQASRLHALHHKANEVQCCHLISVKTGGCSEDCSYCAQSARYQTHVKAEPMMTVEEVRERARQAKSDGMTRVCLVAAWREPREQGAAFQRLVEMTQAVRTEGLEVCCSLGMLQQKQLHTLREAGAYAINHNLDTSEDYYSKVITTRSYEDRLQTLKRIRAAGLSVCCGGIIGMGESIDDRMALLQTLSSMHPHPESVPINLLCAIKGTPFENRPKTTVWELLRMVATARIAMPNTMLRLSAGRKDLTLSQQALCFIAGANSIHTGEKLLTTPNQLPELDRDLFRTLGLKPRPAFQGPLSNSCRTPLSISSHMHEHLQQRSTQGTLRQLRSVEGLIDLTSNDYLGFSRCARLRNRIDSNYTHLLQTGEIESHIGSTGSRLLTGNSRYLEKLEQTLANYHRGEAALLFNSGYVANLGLLSTVAGKEDTVILDSQVHASTWDGARLSGARLLVFHHNDPESLKKQIAKAEGRIFVCIESLYSVSGNIGALQAISTVCATHGASLIVDESHATGVYGPQGRGIVCAQNLEDKVFARVFTFSKAMGCHGATVIGSQLLKKYLINYSRPFIYSTAFPLHNQVAIASAYELCEQADPQRQQLQRLIMYFRSKANEHKLNVGGSQSPIQAIHIGNALQATSIANECIEAGLHVRPLLHPTVRRGQECLRICLHAFNSEEHLELLFPIIQRRTQLDDEALNSHG